MKLPYKILEYSKKYMDFNRLRNENKKNTFSIYAKT